MTRFANYAKQKAYNKRFHTGDLGILEKKFYMHKVLKLIFSSLIYFIPLFIQAQNKYAVLVGIDDYYDAPGKKSNHNLGGCVNDMKAINALLVNQFGFDQANVRHLYNADATKKNFMELMLSMVKICKRGDAFVFYYSGHGVWMNNNFNNSDQAVKKGKSQAIVMSDLYTENWGCLVRDETIKEILNNFIDKKVIVTSVFDCCFSANLPMSMRYDFDWGDPPFTQFSYEKFLEIKDLHYKPKMQKPTGCRYDALNKLTDSTDTDKDGVPDCKDWEINSRSIFVDSMGVANFEEHVDDYYLLDDPYYDPKRFIDTANAKDSDQRSFDVGAALTLNIQATQARPSERKNSNFFSLSATDDYSKGLEIRDLAGVRHGAFTAALLNVFKKYSTDIPANRLMQLINTFMLEQQLSQGPTYHYDSSRLKKNFIGIPFTPQKIRASCQAIRGAIIVLNAGGNQGISVGNILSSISNAGKKIQVTKIYADSCTAALISSGLVKKDDWFQLSDPYTISKPLIKLYVPVVNFTPAGYKNFMDTKIAPLMKSDNYMDIEWRAESFPALILWDNATQFRTYYGDTTVPFYAFLPVPSFVGNRVKRLLEKDQNVQLVSDPNKADLILYINFSKERTSDPNGYGYYFYFYPPQLYQGNNTGECFSHPNASKKARYINENDAEQIAFDVRSSLYYALRNHIKELFNMYPRR
jgi:hypothetical protein